MDVVLVGPVIEQANFFCSFILQVLKKTLTVWNELISKQPDIFNDRSMILIHQMIGDQPSDEIISLALQHLKSACVLHEFNRQNIINANTLDIVKPLLKNSTNEVRVKSIKFSPENSAFS